MTRKQSVIPDAVEKITTTGTGPAEGTWKLTLNHKPPPGSNIIVFLPVCKDPSNNQLIVSPGTTLTPQVAPALDFSSGNEQFPVFTSALDLSKKCISSDSISPLSIKTEREDLNIVGKRDEILNSCTEIASKKGNKTSVVTKTIALDTKKFGPVSMESTLPILITDVRTEASGAEVGAPESCQQVNKEIKLVVEHRSPD